MPIKVIVAAVLSLVLGAAGFLGWDIVAETYLNRIPPCDKLPTEEVVRAVLAQHPDLVAEIESAGAYSIEIGHPDECKDKAYIVIQYDVAPTENRIRKVIGKSFYGVPYWMQNI